MSQDTIKQIGRYDGILEFVEARIESISRNLEVNKDKQNIIGDAIDKAALIELRGVKRCCEVLNEQESLINGAIFGGDV